MKKTYITILVLTLSAAGCSAMLEFKDYGNADCGNGVVDGNEQCDNGLLNSDSTDGACRTDCRNAHCGDGWTDTFELGEFCDSGPQNGVPGRCNVECSGLTPGGDCGNGTLDAGEACDDADSNGQYGSCAFDCSGPGPRCGDGIHQPGNEACEGTEFGGQTCATMGYGPGTLSCNGDCMVELEGCAAPPTCQPAGTLACDAGTLSSATTDMGSTNGTIGYCGNAGEKHTGREMIYTFQSPIRRQITVDLELDAGDLDLFVIREDATQCSNPNCVGASVERFANIESVSFMADPFVNYLIVVDGFQGDDGQFSLTVGCLGPEICNNNVDDNGDGFADCGDPECVGTSWCTTAGGSEYVCDDGLDNDGNGLIDCQDPECVNAGVCDCSTPATSIQCNHTISADNYGAESTSSITGGWCGMPAEYGGGERVFKLDPSSVSGYSQVTFLVDQMTADFDVFIMESNSGACSVNTCSANQPQHPGGTAFEQGTVLLNSGVTYHLVVDGWHWAKGEFNVTATCF